MTNESVEPNPQSDFRCRICGSNRYVAIEVRRDGKWVRTPFYKCCGCTVMFEDPFDFAGLRMHVPGNELYQNNFNSPGHKPMIPSAPNPFMPPGRRMTR